MGWCCYSNTGEHYSQEALKKIAHCCLFPESSLVEAVCSKHEICEVRPLFLVELAHMVGSTIRVSPMQLDAGVRRGRGQP